MEVVDLPKTFRCGPYSPDSVEISGQCKLRGVGTADSAVFGITPRELIGSIPNNLEVVDIPNIFQTDYCASDSVERLWRAMSCDVFDAPSKLMRSVMRSVENS